MALPQRGAACFPDLVLIGYGDGKQDIPERLSHACLVMRDFPLPKWAQNTLLALAGICLVFVIVLGTGLYQTEPNDQYRPPAAEGQNAEFGGAITMTIGSDKSGERQHEGKWYDTFIEHTSEWLIAVFNGLLVYVTYRLVTTTGDLRDSTDKLWAAGERQIELTRKSIRDNRRQHEISNRAFIYAKSIDLSSVRNVQGVPLIYRVNVTWTNSGNTPTRSLTVETNWATHEGDLPPDFPYAYQRASTPVFLGPNAEAGGDTIEIPAWDVENAEQTPLYVWGRACYWDIFPNTPLRETRFCYRVINTRADHGGNFMGFAHHGAYNSGT